MKKIGLALFIFASISAVSAQKVIKSGYMALQNLGPNCKTFPSVVDMELDAENQKLTFYAWSRVEGTYDIKFLKNDQVEAPKTNKEKFGKFMKKLDAVSDAGGDGIYAGLLSVRTLTFENLMNLPSLAEDKKSSLKFIDLWEENKANVVIKSEALQYANIYFGQQYPNAEYKFSRKPSDLCGGKIKQDITPLYTLEDFYKKYPTLDLTKKRDSSFYLGVKGEGLLGTKNMKYCVIKNKYEYGFNPTATMKIDTKEDVLNMEAVNSQLGDCSVRFSEITLDDKNHFAILRGSTKEDKWGGYKTYKIAKFNEKGELKKVQEVKLPFLKEPTYFNFVYDEKGNKKGIMLILSDFVMIGGKSQRDPKDNNFFLYYFDNDLNEKFHYEFEHGKKNRAINPILILEKGDNFMMWNGNADNIFKPYSEIINFDIKGKGTFVKYSKDDLPGFQTHNFSANSSLYKVRGLEDGNLMLTTQNLGEKDVPATPTIAAHKVTTYENVLVMVVNPKELDVVASQSYGMGGGTPAEMDYLGMFDGKYKFMLYSKARNHLAAMGKTNETVTYPKFTTDHEIRVPIATMHRNYKIDTKTRKIYCFYENYAFSDLGYVVVMEY